jgi:hypothetical protein
LLFSALVIHGKELRVLGLHKRVEADVKGLEWNQLVQKFYNLVDIARWDKIEKRGLKEERQEKTT